VADDEDPALSEPWDAMMHRAMANPLPKSETWKPSPHTAALKQIMDGLQKLPGWKRIRKRHVGRFIVTDGAGNPRKAGGKWLYVSVAVKGDPDLELLWTPPGARRPLAIAVEVKTGSGRLSDAQRDKQANLLDGGVFYVVASSAAEAFEEALKVAAYVREHG